MTSQTHLFPPLKRAIDLLVACAALLVLFPVLVVCAIAVRLSSTGPILFCQPRLGLHGKPFSFFKFRTMYHDCLPIRNSDGSAYTADDDPRVTPVGHLLRKTSLDELPQLFNVIRGEMSLVGPRPDQVDQLRFYTENEKRKLLTKPGLTGLAQINGRNNICWERRKALDLEYVDGQCLWMDLSIIVRTIPYVLLRKDVNPDDDHSTPHPTSSH